MSKNAFDKLIDNYINELSLKSKLQLIQKLCRLIEKDLQAESNKRVDEILKSPSNSEKQ